MRIILLLPELRALIKLFLLHSFFGTKLASASSSINENKTPTALFQLLKISLKYFSVET